MSSLGGWGSSAGSGSAKLMIGPFGPIRPSDGWMAPVLYRIRSTDAGTEGPLRHHKSFTGWCEEGKRGTISGRRPCEGEALGGVSPGDRPRTRHARRSHPLRATVGFRSEATGPDAHACTISTRAIRWIHGTAHSRERSSGRRWQGPLAVGVLRPEPDPGFERLARAVDGLDHRELALGDAEDNLHLGAVALDLDGPLVVILAVVQGGRPRIPTVADSANGGDVLGPERVDLDLGAQPADV